VSVLEILGSLCMFVGCVFALTGAVGVLRMPDFYTRLHPAGKSDTLAQGAILFGLALFAGQQLINAWPSEDSSHADAWIGVANIILKLLLLTALLFLTAPTATHAIAKGARLDRYTRLPFDVEAELEEAPGPVLDVRETTAEDDEP
jgi:multicomponent Na+:H+ antiporter subunit G